MDDTLLFIPPCCVDKKLPKALMQAPMRALTFYTHADVTMEKFYRAVSFLLVDAHVMALAMPAVTNETAVFLSQCFERKWISALVLSTSRKNDELIDKYLSEFKQRILYVRSTDVSEVASHMVLYNKDRALTINGPMYNQLAKPELTSYSAVFYPLHCLTSNNLDWGNPLRNILLPDVLRQRQEAHKQKREVADARLKRFLACDFPPYKGENDELDAPKDHYSFSNI